MGGKGIVISLKVAVKLHKLEQILYKKEYFGFLDSSINYVDNIRDTIYSIPDLRHCKTKKTKIGAWFVRHKVNAKTTYYITFDFKGDRFVIKDILTNHEKEYKNLVG